MVASPSRRWPARGRNLELVLAFGAQTDAVTAHVLVGVPPRVKLMQEQLPPSAKWMMIVDPDYPVMAVV